MRHNLLIGFKRLAQVSCSVCLLWGLGAAHAQANLAPSPRAVLEQTSQQMFAALDRDRTQLKTHPEHIYDIVEKILVPHVDLDRASRWVLGRHWKDATPSQRARFQQEFHALLVRFYSAALVEYVNGHDIPKNVIAFLPQRQTAEGTDAVVRTEVRRQGRPSIPVSYDMHWTPDGWKVCNVTVDGVSIIEAYRSVFASHIRAHGLDGLITTMAAFNQRLLETSTP